MLPSQVGKEIGSRAGASCFYIFVAVAYALDRLGRVLLLPLEVGSQSFVERGGGILTTPLGVFLKLGPALWFEWKHIHSLNLASLLS